MKVLIVSHVPITPRNNMGKTFISLFSAFSRDELCQMYIYPSYPDGDRCASFYRVTDKDVLRTLLWGTPGGAVAPEQIRQTEGFYENPKDESFYRNRKNKSALRRLLRDAMWKLSRWNNAKLKAWLDREKPDCIFVAPGAAKFIYDFAMKISRMRKIPIITYICDEYYFVRDAETLLEKIRLAGLKGKMEALLGAGAHLIVISEELRSLYSGHFGIPATTLMSGTGYPRAAAPQIAPRRREISYFGNIRCNRFLSLVDVGMELDSLNRELGTDYRLKIYTAEKDPGILELFSGIASVELCGFLSGAAFEEAFHRAQLLLHVEAFDEKSVDFVQHSVSTKIADSLACGIPLLAYGPEEISSMQHLLRNNCALTATGKENLRKMLLQAFTDDDAVRRAAENALAAAAAYHDTDRNSLQLKQIIAQVINGKN